MKTSLWICFLTAALAVAFAFPACGSDGSGSGGQSSATEPSTGGSTPSNSGGSGGTSNAGGSTATSAGGSNAGGSTTTTTTTVSDNPTAKITSPADGDSFAVNASIPFAGSASDAQDGALTGTALSWVGDIAGIANPEGEGISGSASFDSSGDHTLTLTATDSDGNTGSKTITLHIQE